MSPASATPAVTGNPDLVITRIWLDGLMVNYSIKNIGTAPAPQTYSYLYVNDLMPAQGGSSLVDMLKPGEENTYRFSNYQWYSGKELAQDTDQVKVDPRGYIELPMYSKKVKVSADGRNEAAETNRSNNSKITLIGTMWNYDLLAVSNMATWLNPDGISTEPGSEGNIHGGHFQIPNRDMEIRPQLETIPQQIPQGWMQGTWGYFYYEPGSSSSKVTAITVPPKLHFVARVGLSSSAVGSDGVNLKFGLKDIFDSITWVGSKRLSTPGAYEDWDINLSDYEGQKDYFILRVEAGASPANDFVIWDQARLVQVND